VNELKVFADDKDIPVLTVSHLNREATRILEEASRKGNQDSGKLLGKSNIGESLLMVDNLDCGITISRDYDRDGVMYMAFHRIKMRDKGSTRDYIAQPFLPDNPIRLVEDFGSIPQFKETLHNIVMPTMGGHLKMDGTSSLSQIIDFNQDHSDNAFSKSTFNIAPIPATNDSPEFQNQLEAFDDGLSQLIIENNEMMKSMEILNTLPSQNPPVQAITFIPRPAISFNPSLIKR
jgi:hypothetical protein